MPPENKDSSKDSISVKIFINANLHIFCEMAKESPDREHLHRAGHLLAGLLAGDGYYESSLIGPEGIQIEITI